MTLLDDILAVDYANGATSGYSYHVMKDGTVVFSSDMTTHSLTAMCNVYDPSISANTVPDKFQLAALYWVLHRWHSQTDANLSSYYHQLYLVEWAKAHHNRLRDPRQGLGTDL